VRDYLENATSEMETPKDLSNHRIHNFIIVAGDTACVAALGRTFTAIAKEIIFNKRPISSPCVVIGGGETTVTLTGKYGLGGPNQEFALSSVLHFDDMENVVIVGFDTDGTDGPTKIAGAIVDSSSLERAKKLDISLREKLNQHNIVEVFEKMSDAIVTGSTGTNVNDLKLLLIM